MQDPFMRGAPLPPAEGPGREGVSPATRASTPRADELPGPERFASPPGEVHAWRIDQGAPAAAPDRAAEWSRWLDREERARLEALRAEPDRARFAARRAALRTILSGYVGRDPRELVFRYSPHGKPELAPSEPAGGDVESSRRIRFSLSGSGDLALLAVTLDHAIGVDVERIRSLPEMDDLANTVFSPAERAEYARLAPEARTAGFFAGWTRKEAWLKARGTGLIGDLDGFDVTLAPGIAPRLLRVAGEPDEAPAWSLLSFVPREGHVGAVAVRNPGARLVLRDFAPSL